MKIKETYNEVIGILSHFVNNWKVYLILFICFYLLTGIGSGVFGLIKRGLQYVDNYIDLPGIQQPTDGESITAQHIDGLNESVSGINSTVDRLIEIERINREKFESDIAELRRENEQLREELGNAIKEIGTVRDGVESIERGNFESLFNAERIRNITSGRDSWYEEKMDGAFGPDWPR